MESHRGNIKTFFNNPVAPSNNPCIPGYSILTHLASGGQGNVWLALANASQTKVAIKIIHAHHIDQDRAKIRFAEAFLALSQLTHPGIVTPIEQGILETGELWHATSFVDGCSLDEYVGILDRGTLSHSSRDRSEKFPVRSVLLLFVKICDAVEEAHVKGVIHRDLKPANIVVDHESNPHILDFGLAKCLNGANAGAMTISEQFIGTPNWASPEQVYGKPGCVDTRSDIYSLGVILYQLLTDQFPYDVGKGLARTMEQIRFAEPQSPRGIVSWVDRDLEAIMLKALAKEPPRRYQTVVDLREDLKNYLDGRPIKARGDGLTYRTLKLTRRHRLATAALAALMLASTVYVIQLNRYSRKMERYAADASRRFRMAREILEENIRETADGLTRLTGAQPLRKQLYEKSYARLGQLIQDEPNDPALLADYARAHTLLGDIAYQLSKADESLLHRRAAVNIWRRLVESDPGNPVNRHNLSIAFVVVGDIHHEKGEMTEARRLYEESLAIDEELAAASPANDSYQDTLCYSYERNGNLDIEVGDLESARIRYTKRHEIAKRLFDGNSQNPACLKNLINSHLHIVALATNIDDYTSVSEHRRRAADLSKILIEINPNDPSNLHLRATALLRLAAEQVSYENGRAEAEKIVEEVMHIVSRLGIAEPGHPFYHVYIVDAYGVLGGLADVHGDSAASLMYCERAYDVVRTGLENNPDDWFLRARQAGLLGDLCNRALAVGDSARARHFAEQSLRAWGPLSEFASNRPDILLQRAYFLVHCPFEDLRDAATAVALSKQAIAERNGARPNDWLVLAEAHLAAGQAEDARKAAREGMSRLPAKDSRRRSELETQFSSIMKR